MKDILKRFVPRRLRRMYRRYVSPVIRDQHYFEHTARKEFFRCAFSALSFNGIDGDYVEFGCCGGVTFRLAYKYARKYKHNCKLWAFDSFCGLPPKSLPEDEHPVWVQGTMSIALDEFKKICREGNIPDSDCHVVAGYYDQTLSNPCGKSLPTNICMAYIDCDMYSSTKTVFEFLMPRLKHGMIMAFDDYYCWSSTQVSGERKACADFFKDNKDWALVPFVQYGGAGGMSFIVENKKLGGSSGSCY
jgi:O-methyltransferase